MRSFRLLAAAGGLLLAPGASAQTVDLGSDEAKAWSPGILDKIAAVK